MSFNLHPNQYSGSHQIPVPIEPDDSSVTTEQTKTNPTKNGRKTKDFLVKFKFNATDSNKSVPIILYHRQLLCSILNAH
jgi:hypothetical protein